MPRGRKRKFKLHFNISPDAIRSVFAIALIALACLSLISFFAPEYALNSKIQQILKISFGYPSIIFPFVVGMLGLLLMNSIKWKIREPRIFIGLLFLLLVSSAYFHIFYTKDLAYKYAYKGIGGGVVGYKIAQLLINTLSFYGGIIVLTAGLVISFILISNVSLDQIISKVTELAGKLKIALGKITHVKKPSKIEIFSGVTEPEALDTQSVEAPSFEVVPSLSEPQNLGEMVPAIGSSKGTSLSIVNNALPYTDKVWELPPLDLLIEPSNVAPDGGDIEERSKIIIETLGSFGINCKVSYVKSGPSVTQYALETETGTKISKISSYQYDLALALASPTGSVRIEAPIPGKSLIGIEVPNNTKSVVNIKSLLMSESMKAMKSKLGIVLGKDVGGQTVVYDISKMPHMLIAGETGSGKSVFIHSLLFSILFRASPQECKFILVDPKRVELVHYNDIPHLLTPVVTDNDKAASVFRWAVGEMERRYKLFETAKVRNIDAYNEKSGFSAIPYVIIVVDELANIMIADPAAFEKSIIRLAQLARATGIHLILAVQRPSTDIITGLIKANIPTRVAFNVASQIDSRVIIDQPGAEKLLGKGDMLFIPPDIPKPLRLQGAYVDDREINNLVNNLKSRGVPTDYRIDILNNSDEKSGKSVSAGGTSVDPLFNEAVEIITSAGKASASLLQRRLSIGYARAARIIDELEEKGVVSEGKGSKARSVIGATGPDNFEEPVEGDDLTVRSIE